MRYRRLQTLGFAALLATLTAIHCLPTEAQADRRRRWTTHGSDRGRLVVACDMRSDTCSDGRKITTTRSTPVPCETSPGVWEMVGVDEACYSVRGLESWAATTSYLAYGAELNRSPWQAVEGASIDGRILTGPAGSARLLQIVLSVSTGPHTLACRMRALSGNSTRLRVHQVGGTGGSVVAKSVGPEWATVFHTWEIGGEPTELSVHIYPDGSTLEIAGCWLTKTDTPGRPCWGGEAPVTCAGDRHTISTEGWPTESGSISVAFKFEEFSEAFSIILDARTAPSSGFNIHYDRSNGRLVHRQDSRLLLGPTVETGKPYFVELRRKGPKVEMLLNGGLVASDDDRPPWSYSPIAVLGKHFDPSNVLYVKGPIRSLTVRSYEEVSP